MGEILGSQLMVSLNITKGMTIAFSIGAVANIILNYFMIPVANADGALADSTIIRPNPRSINTVISSGISTNVIFFIIPIPFLFLDFCIFSHKSII